MLIVLSSGPAGEPVRTRVAGDGLKNEEAGGLRTLVFHMQLMSMSVADSRGLSAKVRETIRDGNSAGPR